MFYGLDSVTGLYLGSLKRQPVDIFTDVLLWHEPYANN